eukprot:jgi/Bigna1/61211/fgenesh1_kg.19_\
MRDTTSAPSLRAQHFETGATAELYVHVTERITNTFSTRTSPKGGGRNETPWWFTPPPNSDPRSISRNGSSKG